MIKFKNFFNVLAVCPLLLLQITGTLSIKDGEPEDIKNIPSIVQIFVDKKFICAGTLVLNYYYVVTAAHCFDDIDLKSKPDIIVKGGASKLDETGIQANVSKIIRHKLYNKWEFNNDATVLELKTSLNDTLVKPAPLCPTAWADGDPIQVYGWGKTNLNENELSNQLQVVNNTAISEVLCKGLRKYSYFNPAPAAATYFCAMNGKTSSKGDSGGPVFVKGEFCGIIAKSVKHRYRFPFGDLIPRIDGYTSVRIVRHFIEQTIKKYSAIKFHRK